jgi:hypothetical protein
MNDMKLGKLSGKLDHLGPLASTSDFVQEIEDGKFGIFFDLHDGPAKKLVCKHCGSDKFEVGTAYCLTAIRCPNCLYEISIHEG